MTIELSKQARAEAITSIQRYIFKRICPSRLGIWQQACSSTTLLKRSGQLSTTTQLRMLRRLQQKLVDLEGDLHAPEFQYWPNIDRKRKKER